MLRHAHGRLLVIRADGGAAIGYGHVMRSMAIAEEWLARGGRCIWVTADPRALDAAGSGRDDLQVVALAVEPGGAADAAMTRKIAEESEADWVMADLYDYTPSYFTSVGARRAGWMIVRDEPLRVTERINAILTPGPQASPDYYPGRDPKCALLIGLDHTLLRSELREKGAQRTVPGVPLQRVLITFGGSDPDDLTAQTLRALQKAGLDSQVKWRVILGPGYRGECPGDGVLFQDLAVEFIRYTSDMGRHYAWADLIVCGASTTLWEALYFGTPAVAIPAADNQRGVFAALAESAAVERFERPDAAFAQWMQSLVRGDESSVAWLKKASEAGPLMVDGRGVERVVEHLLARN